MGLMLLHPSFLALSPFTELKPSPQQVCVMAQSKALHFGYCRCGASSALAFYNLPSSRATPVACSCTPRTGLHTPSDGFAIVCTYDSTIVVRAFTEYTYTRHSIPALSRQLGTNNATLAVPIVHVTFAPFHLQAVV